MKHLHLGERVEAERLVKAFHYSRRMPGNIQIIATWHQDGGLFGDSGPAVAACIFSIPPTRWSEPVLELTRLVRDETFTEPLSGLISATVRQIRRKGISDLLVSFADATVGHHGGVYQACSWRYHGQRETSMDGVIIGGKFVPGRTCNSIYGTRSPDKLRAILGKDVEPHYDDGKHLYWFAVNKNGRRQATRMGLTSMPYPKPAASDDVAA
jgi:hypothetical protein